jgi:hypothetical protein
VQVSANAFSKEPEKSQSANETSNVQKMHIMFLAIEPPWSIKGPLP